ncbi:MAG: biotin/lipoyl-containing protein, partial [Burkholderiaceae bacterium]
MQRWLKSVGETVAENEPLIEVETDKVTIEIPAPASGVLAQILKQEQEEIAAGELLGMIEVGGEAPSKSWSIPEGTAREVAASDRSTAASVPAPASGVAAGQISPAVRRLLAQHGLQASAIRGSGAGGRITVDDVLAHVSSGRSSAQPDA